MGVKELWTVLAPYAETKPRCELRGKKIAIDLSIWVVASLSVANYNKISRADLRTVFFRTRRLISEGVIPIFILEGAAPKLKSQIICERAKLRFRGTKPSQRNKAIRRTRFNQVLKQCKNLLQSMGVQCVYAPGEAEAYCAFLNKKGLVDGVISQDSDCFAYGALRVYRNFSLSATEVEIYDMEKIKKKMDFGQNKAIVMALLCGCDYCPGGIRGIGRINVQKLFNMYKDVEILQRIRSWRREDSKYTALEMRVDDNTICSNCGHGGRTQSHTKSGCGICGTREGCDESLWKEERLSLKTELELRKKALTDPSFPSKKVITEFLNEPTTAPRLNIIWQQPNMVTFVKKIRHLLQWTEIKCFQKFLPILARWQLKNMQRTNELNTDTFPSVAKLIQIGIERGVFSQGNQEQLRNLKQKYPGVIEAF
ncbi:flap endonuclease GEN-like [Anastrepha ludens]|uniref:flap endonuclease GEN-like n=1 Tax=Anastrepha ludens TaxID=28586 RepID=UPI0023B19A85|nr:flap endonuclease GEN-like [Anastrepha ludens]